MSTGKRLAIALVVIAGLNLGALYAFPNYAALVSAGNTGAHPLHETADSGGHRLTLVAGYADSLRTMLFVQPDIAGYYVQDPTLDDQFGNTYRWRGGETGALWFEPMVWPASVVGGRLTLRVGKLDRAASAPPGPANRSDIRGQWRLHANLIAQRGHDLPAPPGLDSVHANDAIIHTRATGDAAASRPQLVDPNGRVLEPVSVLIEDRTINAIFRRSGSGDYRLRLAGAPEQVITLSER